MPSREPLRRVVRGHPVRVGAGLAVLAALLLTTLLGGWAPSSAGGVVPVAPGEEVDVAPFRVRLDDARAAYEHGGRTADPGLVLVVVEGRLELTADDPVQVGTVDDLWRAELPGGRDPFGAADDEPHPEVRVRPDGSGLIGLGPGLAYDVALVWVVEEERVPDALRVRLAEHVLRRSSLDDRLGWHDPEPAAEVVLPVAPLTGERPEEDW